MIDPTSDSPRDPVAASDPPSDPRPEVTGAATQLFVVPFFMVLFVVVGGLVVFRLFHEQHDPRTLVRELQIADRDSWQKAYVFSELLRNPENESIKLDPEICRTLASILAEQLDADPMEASRAEFCVFLCRALGEFHLPDALPVLIDVVESDSSRTPLHVRCAALEAVSVLAANVGPEQIRVNPRALPALVRSTASAPGDQAPAAIARLHATAAYALGVVGGRPAIARLTELCADDRSNVRYNAATGLARHGDAHAVPVLLEMLDPHNQAALQDEGSESARQRKRVLVLNNAMRAAIQLVTANPAAERQSLRDAIEKLSTASTLPARIRIDARRALQQLDRVR